MWGCDILEASHFGQPWDVGNDHSFLTHRNFKRSARAHGWGQELSSGTEVPGHVAGDRSELSSGTEAHMVS